MIQRTIRGPPNAQTGSTSNQLTPKAPYKLAPDLGRNAGAVVAHADLDGIAEISRRHLQGRRELRVASRLPALGRGVEAVAEEVETDPGDVLRHQLDWGDALTEIAFQGDVEILILGAGAVIGEVQ